MNRATPIYAAGIDSAQLRKICRNNRKQLPSEAQKAAASQCLTQCLTHKLFTDVTRVACYLASDGELDPHPIIEHLWQQNKQVVVPVITSIEAKTMVFVDYHPTSQMIKNAYGIIEPDIKHAKQFEINQLDLIFTPLVAFDHLGNRLGMGGGYYDRVLAPLKNQESNTQLIGLAHDCQQVSQLTTQPWDIPLQKIITPTQYLTVE